MQGIVEMKLFVDTFMMFVTQLFKLNIKILISRKCSKITLSKFKNISNNNCKHLNRLFDYFSAVSVNSKWFQNTTRMYL